MINKEKIIVLVETIEYANSPTIKGVFNSLKRSFFKSHEFTMITSNNELLLTNKKRVILIIGRYPKWFNINKKNTKIIHLIGDKYKINNYIPAGYFTRFYTYELIKNLYFEKPKPDIILVNNSRMQNDFQNSLKKLNLKAIVKIVPANITDEFNNNLINEINSFNKIDGKPLSLYNSGNILSSDLIKNSINSKCKEPVILICKYNDRLPINGNNFICSLLNYRTSPYKYYKNFYNPIKAFVLYSIYPLRLLRKNKFKYNFKKELIFNLFQNYFSLGLNLIDLRWKGSTKLPLAISLGIPLVTLPEESIIEFARITNYPIIICKNSKEIIKVLKTYDWQKVLDDCKKKQKESMKIYREIFYLSYLDVFNT